MTDHARPFLVPQVNVNDDTVLLVRWTVPQHARVAAGDVVCEVETTKATSEVTIDHPGILEQTGAPGSRVRVGETIGIVGQTREAIAAFNATSALQTVTTSSANDAGEIRATPKARALAEHHGLSLDAVAARVQGTVKESDVRQFLDERSIAAPETLRRFVDSDGPLAPFDAAVAASLRHAIQHQVLTSIDFECTLIAAHARLQQSLAAGRMVSLLHFVIGAAGRALPRFPRLMSVAIDGHVYRYRAVDVAFVARSPEGRLYTPIVRGADRASVEDIARASQAATLAMIRHTLKGNDLEGACFTVSHVPVPGTSRVVALPNYGQSAVLGVSAERSIVTLRDGVATSIPVATLTLTYDHTQCDGVYAAEFLTAVATEVESLAR